MKERTTTTKRRQLTTKFIGTLKSLLCSLFISSDRPPLPDLPLELVAEILCRLPVKLLLQLRCLCKSFDTLISDPYFAKKHLYFSTTNRNLVLTTRTSTIIFYRLHSIVLPHRSIFKSATVKSTQLHVPFNPLYNKIVGSWNGILCFTIEDFNIVEQSNILLFNPSISKFKILPSFKFQQEGVFIKYGFGYDHVTDVYKVVAVFSCDYVNKMSKSQGMVYTLGTNSWRMIQGDLPLPHRFRCESLVFVSGALNWIAYEDNDNHSVVSFGLVIESYRRLLLPNYGGENVSYVMLGVLRDCLCFVAPSLELANVWLMKEYGNEESWTKLFCVPYMNDFFLFPYAKPLWIYEDDQVLMDYSLLEPRIKLAIYDFKNVTLKKILTQDIKSPITSEVCVESLISPCF